LQLKARTAPHAQDANGENPESSKNIAEPKSSKEEVGKSPTNGAETDDSLQNREKGVGKVESLEGKNVDNSNEKNRREPDVVNSRAAALGTVPDAKRDVSKMESEDHEPFSYTVRALMFFDPSLTLWTRLARTTAMTMTGKIGRVDLLQ
jgi:hypothetical protein